MKSWTNWKINSFLGSIREVRLQCKLLPPNWRHRPIWRITIYRSRNPQAETSGTSATVGKPKLQLMSYWRLSVAKSENQKLQEDPVICGYIFLLVLPPGPWPGSHGEYLRKIPHASVRARGKVAILNIPEHLFLTRPILRRSCLTKA